MSPVPFDVTGAALPGAVSARSTGVARLPAQARLPLPKVLLCDLDGTLIDSMPTQRHDLLEVIEDRYGRVSTVVTSQLPVGKWHEWIGDPTMADAILDRLVNNAYKVDLKGPSSRRPEPEPSH